MATRQRFGNERSLVFLTSSTPTDIIPAESGIAPAIVQLAITNRNGDLRNVRLTIGNDEWFTFSIGGSGTIIWDMYDQEELPAGSGFKGSLDANLGTGNVEILARYVRYDERSPRNVPHYQVIPSTTRTPNKFGNQ
jgi:hypothetical protein